MKKILGIFGLTLVLAITFFNMSSVVTADQNVDLASIIQLSTANAERYGDAYEYETSYCNQGTYTITDKNGNTKSCHYMSVGICCEGCGNVQCNPDYEYACDC